MGIPIHDQYFVEQRRNNEYSWGMFGGLCGVFVLYGLGFHWVPRLLRKRKAEFRRTHKVYGKLLRVFNLLNATFRVRSRFFGTFYIQTSVFLVLFLYILWLAVMCSCGTADLNYFPRYYIIGKRVGKIAVGNMPLLLLFVTKNDVMTVVTGWPAHHLTLLHIWMGRILYAMIVLHIILTAYFWLSLNFKIMIIIPPQIIGWIAFASMSLLTLLSTGFIRRLSYEFFLFNHGFFSFLMLLGGYLHNSGGKVGIFVAVHALVLDRMVKLVRSWINYWCMKPDKHLATFSVLDSQTIKIVLPITEQTLSFRGRSLHTFGNWTPGQHIYIKVPSVGRFEWHPYTIANLSSSREMLIIMKVYKGFTKRLFQAVTSQCQKLGSESCQLKTWFHGTYGATISPLLEFDSVLFVAGGTGASFTFPLALDLAQKMVDYNVRSCCQRIRFVWYTRSRDNLDWYEPLIVAMQEVIDSGYPGMISFEIYLTSLSLASESNASADDFEPVAADLENGSTVDPKFAYAKESFFTVTPGKPNVCDIVETEISEQCRILSKNRSKEVAVLSCGPSALVSEVAFEAERQERCNKGLNVYRYVEKYLL